MFLIKEMNGQICILDDTSHAVKDRMNGKTLETDCQNTITAGELRYVWTWTKTVFREMERREQSVVAFIEISTSAGAIWKKDDSCLGLVDFQMPVFRYVYKGHLI